MSGDDGWGGGGEAKRGGGGGEGEEGGRGEGGEGAEEGGGATAPWPPGGLGGYSQLNWEGRKGRGLMCGLTGGLLALCCGGGVWALGDGSGGGSGGGRLLGGGAAGLGSGGGCSGGSRGPGRPCGTGGRGQAVRVRAREPAGLPGAVGAGEEGLHPRPAQVVPVVGALQGTNFELLTCLVGDFSRSRQAVAGATVCLEHTRIEESK